MSLIGRFVELPNDQGFANLVSIEDGTATVEIFYSVARQERIVCKTKDLKYAYLAKQTRVYCRNEIGYDVGRVVDFLEEQERGVVYTVRFPNSRERDIKEQDLFVRPWSCQEDPVEIFGMQGGESQFLYDRRQPYVTSVRKLRKASHGIDAICSANVELVEHQINAVQRILSDPVQRYLLADEVGMGKTIEAGLVAKQHLVDNPKTEIGVCVPEHLVGQWENELFLKLGLDEYKDQILIFPHDEVEYYQENFNVLIIDEAHNITRFEDTKTSESYELICAKADVLLLLTATPPMGDYKSFYKILQLLDPEQYSNGNFADFQKKIQDRVEIGRILLSLGQGTSPTVLKLRANKLISDFAHDPLIVQLATELKQACEFDNAKIEESASRLKTFISEKYRLSQRIIRSRRADTRGWEFQFRGPSPDIEDRSHILFEELYSEEHATLNTLIEEWRIEAFSSLDDNEPNKDLLIKRLEELLAFSAVDAHYLAEKINDYESLFHGEEKLLFEMQEVISSISEHEKNDLTIKSIERLFNQISADVKFPIVVMFLPNEALRDRFLEKAKTKFQDIRIINSIEITNIDISLESVLRSAEKPILLLLDSEHEEGLNLSDADALVHYDLLFDVSRLEQRIGRIDRFGRKKGNIKHRIIVPSEEENSYWHLWLATLIKGFKIFHGSVSNVQFLINELTAQIFEKTLEFGSIHFEQSIAEVAHRIDQVRREQDEQFALDRITNEQAENNIIISDLEEVEEHEKELMDRCDTWLFKTLNLYRHLSDYPDKDLFKVQIRDNTLVPLSPWMKQIDTDSSKLTWKRYKAVTNPGVQVFRPGCTIFDQLDRYTQWDDRGRVYATYRKVNGWQSDELIFFKLDVTISPTFRIENFLNPSISEKAILRKLNAYFPLIEKSIYLDLNCSVVTDPVILSFLSKRYDPKKDINLSSRPERFNEFLDLYSHQIVSRSMYETAKRIMEKDSEVIKAKSIALGKIQNNIRNLDAIYSERDLLQKNVLGQKNLLSTIKESLTELKFELDAFGCYVLGA